MGLSIRLEPVEWEDQELAPRNSRPSLEAESPSFSPSPKMKVRKLGAFFSPSGSLFS